MLCKGQEWEQQEFILTQYLVNNKKNKNRWNIFDRIAKSSFDENAEPLQQNWRIVFDGIVKSSSTESPNYLVLDRTVFSEAWSDELVREKLKELVRTVFRRLKRRIGLAKVERTGPNHLRRRSNSSGPNDLRTTTTTTRTRRRTPVRL